MTTLDLPAARDLLALAERDDTEFWTVTRGLGFLVGGWRLKLTRHGDMIVDHAGNTFIDDPDGIPSEPYAEDLNAITDLIERVLPECSYGFSVEPPLQIKPPFDVKYHAYVGDHWPTFNASPGKWWGETSYAEEKALALCIAFLRALISKAEANAALSEHP